MPSQSEIDRFTLAFHQRAVARLRADPALLVRAKATLARWRKQRGHTASDSYFDEWHRLLENGPDAVERAACADSDTAAALRSVSPLGFVLSPAERVELLHGAWH
jgi:hypothetical protein